MAKVGLSRYNFRLLFKTAIHIKNAELRFDFVPEPTTLSLLGLEFPGTAENKIHRKGGLGCRGAVTQSAYDRLRHNRR